jgi:hypothetical protein
MFGITLGTTEYPDNKQSPEHLSRIEETKDLKKPGKSDSHGN